MGRFRYVYVRWEELDLDPTSSPGSYVLQYLKLLEIFKKKYIDKIYIVTHLKLKNLSILQIIFCNYIIHEDVKLRMTLDQKQILILTSH